MPAVSLNHYTILVQDLERTKDFYEDIVGLKSGDRPPLNFDGYWLYCGGEPVVHLIANRAGDPHIDGAPGTGRTRPHRLPRREPAADEGPADRERDHIR